MGYYNIICLNTQRAHSCALSKAAAGEWCSELNELTVWHWKPLAELGLEKVFSVWPCYLLHCITLALYLLPRAVQSQADTCTCEIAALQSSTCIEISKFCTKVCKRLVPCISLQIAIAAGAASLHQPSHWLVWSRGSRREGHPSSHKLSQCAIKQRSKDVLRGIRLHIHAYYA